MAMEFGFSDGNWRLVVIIGFTAAINLQRKSKFEVGRWLGCDAAD